MKILNIGMSSTMFKKYSYYKSIVIYTTDFGYAFENKQTIEFYQTDSNFIADYDLRTSAAVEPNSIGQVRFFYSGNVVL